MVSLNKENCSDAYVSEVMGVGYGIDAGDGIDEWVELPEAIIRHTKGNDLR